VIPLARVFRDYRDADSLAGLIDLWGFVDDTTLITKSGSVGMVYRVRGADGECLDHAQRRQLTHRFEAAVRLLDVDTRLYQYLVKRQARPIPLDTATIASHVVAEALARRRADLEGKREELYEFETYFVLVYEGWRPTLTSSARLKHFFREPVVAVRNWLSPSQTVTLLREELDAAVRHLHDEADAFASQLTDCLAPILLDKHAAFTALRQLVNYSPEKREPRPLLHDGYLDFFVGDSALSCHRAHLEVDDVVVRILTLKDPPTRTHAAILDGLETIPCQFVACSEWRRLDNAVVRHNIRAQRRHFHNAKVSLVNYLSTETRPEDLLVDDSAAATVGQLGQALTEMEVHGHFFGEFGLTVVVHDRDAERVRRGVNAALKLVAAHDGALHEETYNALNAWLAVLPGGAAYNLRRLPLLETHYADLSFLFTFDSGEVHNPVTGLDYVAVFETEHQTPYYYQLHAHDVGHTFVSGATGSGKSFLLNFLLLHAQRFNPLTIIFDLGGSYRKLTSLLGGSYVRVGLERNDFTINPWCLPPTPENLHFLAAWTRVLIQSGGQYQTTLLDDRAILEAVEAVYHVDPSLRRLCTLANLLPRALSQYLARWVGSGPYATVFDHPADTLTFREFQTFDFDAMQEYPAVLEALLFYVFHRVNTAVHDPRLVGRLKLFVMDEAWRFVLNDVILRYAISALKTWRKHFGSMVLATQNTDDLGQATLLPTVLEACLTKFFLANPGLNLAAAAQQHDLNHTEAQRIKELAPRRQCVLKRTGRSAKVLNLNVDRLSYWLYTNTPFDTDRANAILAEHGLEAGLELLAQVGGRESIAC
jgi:type IV secretion/conjugal transfer VirB4 family ATPase